MGKDRQLTNLRVFGVSSEALDHFVDNNKSFLFLETVSGIKQAIKLIAGDLYYFREDRKRQFPMASEILLQPYKCYL